MALFINREERYFDSVGVAPAVRAARNVRECFDLETYNKLYPELVGITSWDVLRGLGYRDYWREILDCPDCLATEVRNKKLHIKEKGMFFATVRDESRVHEFEQGYPIDLYTFHRVGKRADETPDDYLEECVSVLRRLKECGFFLPTDVYWSNKTLDIHLQELIREVSMHRPRIIHEVTGTRRICSVCKVGIRWKGFSYTCGRCGHSEDTLGYLARQYSGLGWKQLNQDRQLYVLARYKHCQMNRMSDDKRC